ncbi:metal-dependent transcriptional regulator [Eubacteriaceae bacterium ES3]|nr:metal-dependent transcriptional regulator [Eubacteriaceae bacterium ES3]
MGKNIKLSSAKEDYLKVMLTMSDQKEIHSCDVADALGVTRASVSHMMMVLTQDGLVSKQKYGKVCLTPEGKSRAMEISRRYDLLKGFLGGFLGVEAEVAARDACQIEHLVSLETLNKIEKQMQNRV